MSPGVRSAAGLVSASFAALFLELLLIRYLGTEIPVLAYFKNFPLLAAFIGLGVGCLLASRPRLAFRSGIASLAVLLTLVVYADRFGWREMIFPDPNLDVWGRWLIQGSIGMASRVVGNLVAVFILLGLAAWAFVWPGQVIGRWLASGEALARYSLDLLGSLLGTLAFAALTFAWTPPEVWLVVAAAALGVAAWLAGVRAREVAVAVAVLAGVAGLMSRRPVAPDRELVWSPYYRIDMSMRELGGQGTRATIVQLDVNHDFHQAMLDLSERVGSSTAPNSYGRQWWQVWRLVYDLPTSFRPSPPSVLVGGAGSGNDVAASLRGGAGSVTAVEIDPGILSLGRRLHPEKPYDSPQVHPVVTDVRSFLRRTDGRYDLIVFGLVDSHTALSSFSTLRLDNYVYTVEGIRDAWNHLAPGGVMCISFWEGHRTWIGARLYNTIRQATGRAPVGGRYDGRVYLLFGPGIRDERAPGLLQARGFTLMADDAPDVPPATDDWPFLYANPHGWPVIYTTALVLLVLGGAGSAGWAMRGVSASAETPTSAPADAGARSRFPRPDWNMAALGAGFLLVETKAIAEISLLFGSTWIVNAFVMAGVFVMVLAANAAVRAGSGKRLDGVYILIGVSLLFWFLIPRASLSALAYWPRAAVGTGLAVLPIAFAGIAFSSEFGRRADPTRAFGFNLIGAVAGGALEALSLAVGIRGLSLLALACYAAAWGAGGPDTRGSTSPAAPPG